MTSTTVIRRALVTGAGSGLGLALVRLLTERGATVLATDQHAEVPESLAGLEVTYRRLDVTDQADWNAAREHVDQTWGGLDLLVNNAGVAAGGRFELSTLEQWEWIVQINLLGVVRGCHTFAPAMQQQCSGRVLNIASAAGLVHPPGMSEYNTVKAAVVAFSETLHHELAPQGVHVAVACPTFFRSNLAGSLRGADAGARASATRLIERSTRTADDVAARILTGLERERQLILTDRDGRIAWAAKRFARPLYDWQMAKAARRMSSKDPR